MGKLFLSENRFKPIVIKQEVSGARLGKPRQLASSSVQIVIEQIASEDVKTVSPDDMFDGFYRNVSGYANYKANVVVGNEIAFSCTLLELTYLAQSLNNSINRITEKI